MLLADLIKDIPAVVSKTLVGARVLGVTSDSRTVRPGDLFFALSGNAESGLKYASDALKKGAVAVVHDSRESLPADAPEIRVGDAREAVSLMAARFYDDPTRAFKLVGVTGTNGKTTLTYLLEKLWQPESVGVIGTINTRFPGHVWEATHTTPDPVRLNAAFSAMRENGVKAVVMEVSSHALDQKRVAACAFDAAVFTNLTQDHLDYHRDMESYYFAKKKLFTRLLAESPKARKVAVINGDDAYGKRLADEARSLVGIDVRTFSLKDAKADLYLESVSYSFSGIRARLKWRGKSFELSTNLIGAHNVANIMAALAVVTNDGDDMVALTAKLAAVTVPGRLQRVLGKNVFVDYAHTPDALQNVLTALDEVRKVSGGNGRIVTVFGCGGDRDRGKRPIMGRIAASLSDVTIVTSDNPRTEDPECIVAEVVAGVSERASRFDGDLGYIAAVAREAALKEAVSLARPDDIVLVAGKGHEDYQIIGREKRHFDDVEILTGLLK